MFLPPARHTRCVNSSKRPSLTSVDNRLARNRRQGEGPRQGDGETLVEVDPRYFRPTEMDFLFGHPSKARAKLGWRQRTSFETLVGW